MPFNSMTSHFVARAKLPLKIALVPLTCGFAAWLLLANPHEAEAGWAEDALKSEADYIVNCSFTAQTANNAQVQTSDAAYGALNNVRVAVGADWVRPGEGAMGIIGLMAAATQLKKSGEPTEKYDAVIDAFFQNWVAKGAAICQKSGDPNEGGFAPQLAYTDQGALKAAPTEFNSGTTGAMLCALWKYAEYNRDNNRGAQAQAWRNGPAYDVALGGAKFIARCYNSKYQMVGPAPNIQGDLWTVDSSLAVAGLRCVAKWSAENGKSVALDDAATSPAQLADQLAAGLEKMKDQSASKGFYKFLNSKDGSRSYGGNLDQLCFVPYETDALDASAEFAREISDFWTDGANGKRMTYQTNDPKSWTYFGTRWHLYDDKNNTESDRLTPGPGLQLAKVEWRYAHKNGDKTLRERAMNRFQFANSPQYSDLWLGADNRSEAGVAGGIVDWREAAQTDNKGATGRAPDWQRFVDTSAYFIEVTLMAFWDKDTKYIPDDPH